MRVCGKVRILPGPAWSLRSDTFLGLKVLNDWPTFPQLIVKGELVGGLDIVQEMVDSGEFAELIA